MRITTVRRISQVAFLLMFLWFCIVSTVGDKFHQLRGWPVNLFLWLDPLTGFATLLTSHRLWAPLVLSMLTIAITIVLGRVFCGWICPFGTIHHFMGVLGQKIRGKKEHTAKGRYSKYQRIKYYILFVFIGFTAIGFGFSLLQTGLFAPIPLLTRSITNVILPIADSQSSVSMATSRYYEGGFLILTIFMVLVLLNLIVPRFYCRYLCPSGALLAFFSRFKLFDFLRSKSACTACCDCTRVCTSGCDPQGNLKSCECVMCFNCREVCPEQAITYDVIDLPSREYATPDISRRGFALSIAGGFFAAKSVALAKTTGENYNNKLVRPPGAVGEEEFQKRCIKCGQCIRICPTNVLQPASVGLGLVNMWTPVLNNRIGSSGCQLNCTACGQVCPTAAIRPISLDEKHGTGDFADDGPIKIGTAFVDRNRCLPWAMDKPCIVCEENCPVSPKAIETLEVYHSLDYASFKVRSIEGRKAVVEVEHDGNIATGDYYLQLGSSQYKIMERNGNEIALQSIVSDSDKAMIANAKLVVRLQRPMVNINKCIGCGTCEHECPVSGKRAIRISAEGETRNPSSRLLLE
ncbi:MAG: 4Fe-4S binding protein [Sedimentisphaeraceae bacterium JB056]